MPFDPQSELGQVTGLGSCGGIDEACDGGAVAVVASMKLVMVVGGGVVVMALMKLMMVGQSRWWH